MTINYNHLSINTLNFRIYITNHTLNNEHNRLGLPLYNGINTTRYFNRKIVKQFIANKIKEIISNPAAIVLVSDAGTKIDLYFPKIKPDASNKELLYEYNRKLIDKDFFPVFERDKLDIDLKEPKAI